MPRQHRHQRLQRDLSLHRLALRQPRKHHGRLARSAPRRGPGFLCVLRRPVHAPLALRHLLNDIRQRLLVRAPSQGQHSGPARLRECARQEHPSRIALRERLKGAREVQLAKVAGPVDRLLAFRSGPAALDPEGATTRLPSAASVPVPGFRKPSQESLYMHASPLRVVDVRSSKSVMPKANASCIRCARVLVRGLEAAQPPRRRSRLSNASRAKLPLQRESRFANWRRSSMCAPRNC